MVFLFILKPSAYSSAWLSSPPLSPHAWALAPLSFLALSLPSVPNHSAWSLRALNGGDSFPDLKSFDWHCGTIMHSKGEIEGKILVLPLYLWGGSAHSACGSCVEHAQKEAFLANKVFLLSMCMLQFSGGGGGGLLFWLLLFFVFPGAFHLTKLS